MEPFAVVRDQGHDVSATLEELERKLHDLERELQGAAAGPPEPAAPRFTPSAPAAAPFAAAEDDADRLVADARRRLGSLSDQIDDLMRFRDDLERLARELQGDHDRALGRLGVEPAPEPPHPHAESAATFAGTVIVDAGPFEDIAMLGAFEQALGSIDGVADVHVSGFEERRATVEAHLVGDVPLAELLAAALPFRAEVSAGAGRLTVDLQGPEA